MTYILFRAVDVVFPSFLAENVVPAVLIPAVLTSYVSSAPVAVFPVVFASVVVVVVVVVVVSLIDFVFLKRCIQQKMFVYRYKSAAPSEYTQRDEDIWEM